MEKKSTLSIALSQEELYVVLAYLKLPRILGLDLSRFAELLKIIGNDPGGLSAD